MEIKGVNDYDLIKISWRFLTHICWVPLHKPLCSLYLSLTHLGNEHPDSDLPKLEHQVRCWVRKNLE